MIWYIHRPHPHQSSCTGGPRAVCFQPDVSVEAAYERLLEKQPEPYHAHRPWLNDSSPEAAGTQVIRSVAFLRRDAGAPGS